MYAAGTKLQADMVPVGTKIRYTDMESVFEGVVEGVNSTHVLLYGKVIRSDLFPLDQIWLNIKKDDMLEVMEDINV
jgi:hypothetical protein